MRKNYFPNCTKYASFKHNVTYVIPNCTRNYWLDEIGFYDGESISDAYASRREFAHKMRILNSAEAEHIINGVRYVVLPKMDIPF